MTIPRTKIGQVNQWLEYSMRSFGFSASSFNTFVFLEEVTVDFGRERVTPDAFCWRALLSSKVGSWILFFKSKSWSGPFEATSGKFRCRNVDASSSSP